MKVDVDTLRAVLRELEETRDDPGYDGVGAADARLLADGVRELRELLGTYGRHLEGCPAQGAPRAAGRCECGWDAVTAAYGARRGSQPLA